MRLADALIALQERLPRLGDPRLGGTPPTRTQARVGLAVFGILASISAVYVARRLGSPELLLHRFSGLPMLCLSLAWVGLLASELLRPGFRLRPPGARHLTSAALSALTWLVLSPVLAMLGTFLAYDAAGALGVLVTAGFFAFFFGLLLVVARYSGPVRRRRPDR